MEPLMRAKHSLQVFNSLFASEGWQLFIGELNEQRDVILNKIASAAISFAPGAERETAILGGNLQTLQQVLEWESKTLQQIEADIALFSKGEVESND